MTDVVVRGARTHNLRSIDVVVPRDKLVVITGPSGSGKSSLAFDTIYAEAERRYVESLSAYARQFLAAMPKPDVDSIEGLSPAISIEQRGVSRNPRSTVGTITEIYDHLRLLYARVGEPHCPTCGRPVSAQTVQQMVDRALELPEGTRFTVQAPVVRGRKGKLERELAELRRQGYVRVVVDGIVHDLGDEIVLDKSARHDLDVQIDRLAVRADVRQRLTDSIELALRLGDGLVRLVLPDAPEILLSERFACPFDGTSFPELTPRTFSFNNPAGACPKCSGLGEVGFFDPERVVPDPGLSIAEGAIAPWGKPGSVYHRAMSETLAAQRGVDQKKPFESLAKPVRERVLRGGLADDASPSWEGVVPSLERRSREYERRQREQGGDEDHTLEYLEEEFARFMTRETCAACGGARLCPEALAVRLGGKSIRDTTAMSILQARSFFAGLELGPRARTIAERILREMDARLGFLVNVGLDYLSLERPAATLSGGEGERIRLATQIGSGLVGVLYVLDEPSIGLHPRDNTRLVHSLRALRDLGNTVIVVEHDAETIRAADHVIDMGPGAGKHGGTVVASGTPDELTANPASLTGQYLAGKRTIDRPVRHRRKTGELTIRGARAHNLQDVTVSIPLGVLTCVTGVSGSGKSSLVVDCLLPAVRHALTGGPPPTHRVTLEGVGALDKVVDVDQAPIGRTPRSNPATYTGLFSLVRELYASLPEARARGYKAGRFSFNVKGGRCEACRGDGILRIEMHFLPDVYVPCEDCAGRRYNRETLEVRYRGLSIADLLALPIDEAIELLSAVPRIRERLEALQSVGLGYVELGQSATTLSGGEAQRIKLARELARRATGRTLYVLDEPTTGLHFSDVEVLVRVLDELVAAGNTVIVIEHNLEVVKVADWVIDLGPEGGDGGGTVVAQGKPSDVARVAGSHTGRYLAALR